MNVGAHAFRHQGWNLARRTLGREYSVPSLVALVLFLLPFGWLGENASLGGDDTRLYFVYPSEWLTEIAIPAFASVNGFGTYNAAAHYAPFTLLLKSVESLVPVVNLEAIAFGISLSSGFIGTYATAMLLTGSLPGSYRNVGSILGGLMFASAPLLATMYWVNPLAWPVGIGGAPVLMALAIAYVKYAQLKWLLLLALGSIFYAVGLAALPVSLPFVFGAAIGFGLFIALFDRRRWIVVRRSVICAAVVGGANAFWLVLFLVSIARPGSIGDLSVGQSADTTARTIRAVAPTQSILDTLLLLPSGEFMRVWGWPAYQLWDWWGKVMPLSLLLPAVIGVAIVLRKKAPGQVSAVFLSLVGATLVLAYFQTVNVTPAGTESFVAIATHVPLFAMFRNFYGKFAGGYVFFYALAFALAICLVLPRIRSGWRWPVVGVFAAAILLQGAPLLLGKALFLPRFHENVADPPPLYGQVGRLPGSLLAALDEIADVDVPGRVLELPFSANYWSVFPLAAADSIYVGSSPIKVMSGFGAFNSMESFAVSGLPELQTRLKRAIDDRDFITIGAILRLAGISHILYTDRLTEEIADVADRLIRSPEFPSNAGDMASLAQSLGATKVGTYSDGGIIARELFEIPKAESLPRVFIANQARLVDSGDKVITLAATDAEEAEASPRIRSPGQPVSEVVREIASSDYLLVDWPDPTAIEKLVRRYPWLYEIDVSVEEPSMLVMLEPNIMDWRAKIVGGAFEPKRRSLTKIPVNGYATAWLLEEPDRYSIELRYAPQRFTWIAGSVTMVTVFVLVVLTVYVESRRRYMGRGIPARDSLG